MTNGLRFRAATPEDRDRLLDLKCRVFGDLILENERARWEWEFLANPARDPERPFGKYFEDEGGVVGAFSFVPHRVWIDDQARYAAAAIDLCVDARARGQGLARKLAGELWNEGLCEFAFGTGTNPASLYLFTDLGATLLGGPREPTAHAYFIQDRHPPLPGAPALVVREVATFGAEQDDLFARICAQQSLMLVKDAAYMNWRYRDYPFGRPTLLHAYAAGGTVRGTAVVQRDPRHDRMFLLDLLAETGDDEARRGLLRAALEIAAGTGHEALYYATRAPLEVPLLRDLDFRPIGGDLPTYICKTFAFARERGVSVHHWLSALGDGDQLYNAGEPRPT